MTIVPPQETPPQTAIITPSSPVPDAPPADQFVRFVRAVQDRPVTRFVKGPGGAPQAGRFFGAERVEGRLVYDVETVHAITAGEWEDFGRIYERNIRERDLVEVKREDWAASVDARKKAQPAKAKATATDIAPDAPPAEGKSDAADEAAKDSNGSAPPAGGEGQ